jgi:hypothetical protein
MRARALPFVVVLLLSTAAEAQVTWQPTPPPLITADNQAWFRAAEPITWDGGVYYPAGAPEPFNRYQMVRIGAYRGIPLYCDTTLELNSIVFVPIAGGRMQPYQLQRTGTLAGTVGSRTSAFPTLPSTEAPASLGVTREGFIAQAPAPPTFAPPYDIGGSVTGTPAVAARAPVVPGPVIPGAVATTGRVTTVTNQTSTAARPIGLNGAWFSYEGRRWVSAGKAVERTSDFTQVGQYRGSPVYQRRGDSTTIYIAIAGDRIAPFTPR